MRSISKKEAKRISGGAHYNCKYCTYKTDYFKGYRDHMWYRHGIRV